MFVLNRIKGKHDYAQRVIRRLEKERADVTFIAQGDAITTEIEKKHNNDIIGRPGELITVNLSDYDSGSMLICEMTEDCVIACNNESPMFFISSTGAIYRPEGDYTIYTAELDWNDTNTYDTVLPGIFGKECEHSIIVNKTATQLGGKDDRYIVCITLNDDLCTYIISGDGA